MILGDDAARPAGPRVGAVRDGLIPGPGGALPYRLYRPEGSDPVSVIAYFHGGGWVLGDLDSDDPLCRDLCVRSGAAVVSVNYRHAPEHRFPAAADDALAAVQWIAANAAELGGIPVDLVFAGWSAGLRWLFDHYADAQDRDDPRFAVLRGRLTGLPPAVLVTAQFDPLRDEGEASADALSRAGVPVQYIRARGHTHTSIPMLGVVLCGARARAEMTEALRGLLPRG